MIERLHDWDRHLPLMALAKGERLRQEMLRKRRINLAEKANELAGKTDSKIPIMVRYVNRSHIYKSKDSLDWLAPEEATSFITEPFKKRKAISPG